MICGLQGRIAAVGDDAAIIENGTLAYQVLIPRAGLAELRKRVGDEITLFTQQYIEGNPNTGNLIPRMVGFTTENERDFFNTLVKVKGISTRKALRAMSLPVHQIAAGIEHGDEKLLASLPEIGPRTAAQIIAQLRGKMQPFLVASALPPMTSEMDDAQKVALQILVQWGDRRADAQSWIARAVQDNDELREPDEIVRAAYRVKQSPNSP